MTHTTRVILSLVCLLTVASRTEAASLKVAPARFIVHNVEPGTLYDIYGETGLRLTVYNDDDVSRTWVLSTHRPSERGHWEKGYAEIPDARWCWFDHDEITVEPNGKVYAHLFLRVPGEEKYYNQHWVVTLGVDGKPGGGGIALAADVRAQIETKSKADGTVKPDGPLGLTPSIIRFEDVAPGSSMKGEVVLHNNTQRPHDYAISALLDMPNIERKTYLTHSYAALPETRWLAHKAKLRIKPGASAVMGLTLKIPDEAAHFGKKWEALLLIRPDDGRAGFVRVQVETKEQPKTE